MDYAIAIPLELAAHGWHGFGISAAPGILLAGGIGGRHQPQPPAALNSLKVSASSLSSYCSVRNATPISRNSTRNSRALLAFLSIAMIDLSCSARKPVGTPEGNPARSRIRSRRSVDSRMSQRSEEH